MVSAMSETNKPVGVIGLGLMGMACVKRLRGAGISLLGFDIDGKKAQALAALGGTPATSVAQIATECDQVVLAVFNTDQVEDTVDALVNARPEGRPALIACCVSTCDPDRVAALVARTSEKKLRYVESPVSGTSDQTEKGDALGMIGGDPAAANEAKAVLDAICPRRHHLGPAGSGGRAKLAINLILGVNRAALAEGLVFAQKLGLDPGAFLKVARESAAQSQVMDIKGPKMVSGDYTPHGFITQTRKDFLLMLEQAGARGQGLPLAETYVSIVNGCVAAGEGEFDNSAVIEEIRRRKPKTA
jgi:3-hydroxyisobutyrate dehydrogenase-like beta-hydroxyacid dehydrogenase